MDELTPGEPIVGLTEAEHAALPVLPPLVEPVVYTMGVADPNVTVHVTEQAWEPLPKITPTSDTSKPIDTAVTALVIVPLTSNQAAALTMYAESIGMDAFAASPMLKALNAGEPAAAMAYLMEDVRVNGRWTYNSYKSRQAERNLFLS